MTYNLGEGDIDVEQLAALVERQHVQVLMLEECSQELANALFQRLGWSHRQAVDISIGSSWPLGDAEVIAGQGSELNSPPSNAIRPVGLACELQLPVDGGQSRTVRLAAVHFPTFRPAFEQARAFDSSAVREFTELSKSYREVVTQARATVVNGSLPTVIAGDFNVPCESAFYRDYWASFQNALTQCGWGLCRTKYTRLHGIRIDHVLADHAWKVRSAAVGPGLGGDHRPVVVELSLN